MKQNTKIALIVAGFAILFLGMFAWRFFAGNYNRIVDLSEGVDSQWAQVENQYQRRLDLIPNLVATVKGYASHEADVLTGVTEARAKAGGVMNVSSDVLDNPESFKRFQEAQSELGGALQRLLVVSENYPELRANENFLALQDQLEGTENRIAVARNRFNEEVRRYNSVIRKFPANIVAQKHGFSTREYFASERQAAKAPAVSF